MNEIKENITSNPYEEVLKKELEQEIENEIHEIEMEEDKADEDEDDEPREDTSTIEILWKSEIEKIV